MARASGLLANDDDLDSDPLTITAINANAYTPGQTLTLASGANLTVNANGSYVYAPAAFYTGQDSFSYTITDGIATATATVSITVTNGDFVWDGGGDGISWSDPLNWVADTLPGSSDDAFIGAGFAVTMDSSTAATVHSLTCAGNLTINGALSLLSNSAISGLLNVYGTLDVETNLTLWGGGTLGGIIDVANAGMLALAQGDFLAVNNTQVAGNGTVVIGGQGNPANLTVAQGATLEYTNVTLQGGGVVRRPGTIAVTSMRWQGGTLADGATLLLNAPTDSLLITGNITISNLAQLNNNGGTVRWQNGNILLLTNAKISNKASGFFSIECNNEIQSTDGTGYINNESTFLKPLLPNLPAGTSTVSALFNNLGTGTVSVDLGTFKFQGGGSLVGNFNMNLCTRLR